SLSEGVERPLELRGALELARHDVRHRGETVRLKLDADPRDVVESEARKVCHVDPGARGYGLLEGFDLVLVVRSRLDRISLEERDDVLFQFFSRRHGRSLLAANVSATRRNFRR